MIDSSQGNAAPKRVRPSARRQLRSLDRSVSDSDPMSQADDRATVASGQSSKRIPPRGYLDLGEAIVLSSPAQAQSLGPFSSGYQPADSSRVGSLRATMPLSLRKAKARSRSLVSSTLALAAVVATALTFTVGGSGAAAFQADLLATQVLEDPEQSTVSTSSILDGLPSQRVDLQSSAAAEELSASEAASQRVSDFGGSSLAVAPSEPSADTSVADSDSSSNFEARLELQAPAGEGSEPPVPAPQGERSAVEPQRPLVVERAPTRSVPEGTKASPDPSPEPSPDASPSPKPSTVPPVEPPAPTVVVPKPVEPELPTPVVAPKPDPVIVAPPVAPPTVEAPEPVVPAPPVPEPSPTVPAPVVTPPVVEPPAPQPPVVAPPAPSNSRGERIVADAMQYVGVIYYSNGASPSAGFDCSGLVQWVYGLNGISMPRNVSAQAAMGTRVSNPQPGDLVVWNDHSHIGIYTGNGMMIDSPDWGRTVQHRAPWTSSIYYVRVG